MKTRINALINQIDLTSFDIREMGLSDVPQVYKIERESYQYPWEECIFSRLVQENFYCLVLVKGEELGGYCICLINEDECHLLNLCIALSFRRTGQAKRLIDFLIKNLQHQSIRYLHLEVRCTNESALALYQALGFKKVGIRPNYYPGEVDEHRREDAILLTLALEQC